MAIAESPQASDLPAERKRSRRKSFSRREAFKAMAASIPIAMLELGSRVVIPENHPYHPNGKVFETNNIWDGTMRTCYALRTVQRGYTKSLVRDQVFTSEAGEDTMRIAIAGASNVFNGDEFSTLKNSVSNGLAYGGNEKDVEIINDGQCGANSDKVLKNVQEVLQHDPNLLVLFTGHNEHFDLYKLHGELSLSDYQAFMVWAEQRARCSRFVQALLDYNQSFVNEDDIVQASERRFENHYETRTDREPVMTNYESNLRAIVQAAREKAVPVIMTTIVSNYHVPPTGQSGRNDSPIGETSSIEDVNRALRKNPHDPRAQYAKGRNLYRQAERLEETDPRKAFVLYQKAGRFLTSSIEDAHSPVCATEWTNNVIRNVAETEPGVEGLVDLDKHFRTMGKGNIPDAKWFKRPDSFDECHISDAAFREHWEPLVAKAIINGKRPGRTVSPSQIARS